VGVAKLNARDVIVWKLATAFELSPRTMARQKRIAESIKMLSEGKKLGLRYQSSFRLMARVMYYVIW
jgi:hypothetical protein